jgi:adenine phosphoribosyltransferase
MNVFDLRPRSPSGFDAIALEFFQDYPEPGVNFIDVGCVFDNPHHWQLAIDALTERTAHLDVDFLLAMDARGFMLAGALAYQRGLGFAMARKPGKLPGDAIGIDYRREYGSATIEIQPERIKGRRVLIVDDVLATGGTIEAAATLLRRIGKEVVGAAALFDVAFFKDKRALTMPVVTLRDV